MEGYEFLRLVASAYVQNEGESVREATFVFPNRRSLIFFRKYLGEEYGKIFKKPLFSPQMLTISELFASVSDLLPVDPIEAQYILYCRYISLKYSGVPFEEAMEREPFDDFLHWGNMILADFNDIDKYLIDPFQLFSNVRDLKQIDSDYSYLAEEQRKAVEKFWSSFLNGGTNFKKESFSLLWNIMYELYSSFRKELEEKGKGYEGMIYRRVAENPQNCTYEKIVFVGFNAPNKCERKFMKWLKNQGRGDFYWDYYGPMVTDRENKASMFISDAVKEFPSKYRIESEHPLPQIHTVGVPSGIGQTIVAADILKGLDSGNSIRTAVVLPDEKLLMPLLDSVPAEYDKVNVTMGYPISATALPSFISAVATLQKSVRMRDGIPLFYYRSLMDLLGQGYIREHAGEEAQRLIDDIVKENMIYVAVGGEILSKVESGLLSAIFAVPENAEDMFVSSSLDKEFIYRYYLAIERLRMMAIPMRKETCLKILQQITSTVTVPFRGEPLAGLQVIGSLEVRALDFENLIILSVNEGLFPASSQLNSLIPYNLRIGFGLPTYELQDAIAAYHFYRSIYRAKSVWLLYDTRSDGIKGGEVSRFVKQLEYQYNIPLDGSFVVLEPALDREKNPIVVEKSEKVMKSLYEAYIDGGGTKSLSASAINTYITCPLQFYLQYVKGLREEDEIEESIEASTFGTIFHDSMEHLYSPYVGGIISCEILDSIIGDVDMIDRVVVDMFKKNRIKEISGRNVIVKEVIKKYVLITLDEDKKYAPFHYVAGEETFYSRMRLSNGESVRFKAVIDRIDRTDSSLRIVDYKTGRVEIPDVESMEELFSKESEKKYKAFVQLYLYAYVLDENVGRKGALELKNGKKVIVAGSEESSGFDVVVYPVTRLKRESIVVEPVYKCALNDYNDSLKRCVEEIFDTSIPFVQAKDGSAACGWCAFRQICGR